MHFSIGPAIYSYEYKIPPGTVTVDPTTAVNGTMPSASILKLGYGAGVFVATATQSQVCYTSPDGVTWTTRSMPGGANGYWSDVVYAAGQFVAVTAGTVNGVSMVATSGDGITWTQRNTPFVWSNLAYGNGTYSAINNTPAVTLQTCGTSPNGISWTVRNALNTKTYYNGMAFGNGVFVGTSSTLNGGTTSNRAISSADGFSWTSYVLPSAANWGGVDFDNGLFIAYTTTAAGAVSSNGTTWTGISVPAGSGPSAYGSSGWVMVKKGTGSSVSVSTNGTTWKTVANALPVANWVDVVYANGKYVFISSSGVSAVRTFLTST